MSNRKKFMLGTVSGVISAAMLAGVLMTGIPVPMTTGGQNDAVYGIQAQAASYQLQGPTQQEIVSFFKAHPFYVDRATEYDTPYSKTQPYAQGAVSAVNRQEALNALNFVRYIAGIPSDVQLKDSYNDGCQIGSLVNAANNELSHYPSKPEGMSDELYNQQMSGKSNIAWNYGNLSKTVVYAWLHDTDSYNMAALGHRRWVLYPEMQYTGFGQVETYNSMYAFDRSRSDTFAGDYIAWPAANTPYELMNDRWGEQAAFSVSLKNWTIPDKSAVKVTMKSTKLNKTWVLDQNSQDTDSAYLNIDTAYYGYQPCIIFRTEELPENDTVDISITGVTKNGSARPIQYTVQFFNMSDIQLNQSSVNLEKGKTFQLTADYASMYSYDSTLTWTSSNDKVATVSTEGKVTAVAEGTAVITAKTANGKEAHCTVTVTKATTVSIAEYKALDDGKAEFIRLDNAEVLYVYGGKAYVRDATGSITLNGVGTKLAKDQVANGYVMAEKATSNNMAQAVIDSNTDIAGTLTVSQGSEAKPVETSLSALTTGLYSNLVTVKACTLERNSGIWMNNGSRRVRLFNPFQVSGIKLPSVFAGKYFDVTGIFGTNILNGNIIEEIYLLSSPVEVAEPTGINSVTATDQTAYPIYTLSGQYVGTSLQQLPKGVYVVKGKKVVR